LCEGFVGDVNPENYTIKAVNKTIVAEFDGDDSSDYLAPVGAVAGTRVDGV
jgi:hypothetical protein